MHIYLQILSGGIYISRNFIQLSSNCELCSYAHGNNLGSLWFIWKAPADLKEQNSQKAKAVMEIIEKGINVYHTREMRRTFCSRYHLLVNTSKAVLLDV